MENEKQRFTVRRVGKPSPYLGYKSRCQFAVETFASIHATPDEQIMELELMLRD